MTLEFLEAGNIREGLTSYKIKYRGGMKSIHQKVNGKGVLTTWRSTEGVKSGHVTNLSQKRAHTT